MTNANFTSHVLIALVLEKNKPKATLKNVPPCKVFHNHMIFLWSVNPADTLRRK